MKLTVLKRVSIVFLALLISVSLVFNAFAETVQDRLENQLNDMVNQYQNATPEEQKSLEERFNEFVEENNLQGIIDNIDLGSLSETDIAKIIGDIAGGSEGGDSFFGDLFGLAQDAWQSGSEMLKDVFSGGSGTGGGENTASTKANQTQPTNVIVAVPNYTPAPTTAPPVQSGNLSVNVPNVPEQTAETTTYNIGSTTAPAIVGAGVTAGEPVTGAIVSEDTGMSTSSIVVLAVLSVATIAVIVAIVVFFVMKRR